MDESKKLYGQKYNKLHSTIQIERELYNELKNYLKDKEIGIRDFVASLIKKEIL